MNLGIVLIVLLILILGGWLGNFSYQRVGLVGGSGVSVVTILVIILVLYLLGVFK